MRNFLVSYRYLKLMPGDIYGFGSVVIELGEGEQMTPDILNDLAKQITERDDLKAICFLSFSEFDKEES